MKSAMSILITALLFFGLGGGLFAAEDGILTHEWEREEILLGGDVYVEFQDMSGNPIQSIRRGNNVQVYASHDPAGPPFVGTCYLLLPVNSSDYREIEGFQRSYQGTVYGELYQFYIPGWMQIEGTAIARVIVQGVGMGMATLEVTP
jgi:hypothetical protein